jgi:Tol biopolymer transport system component
MRNKILIVLLLAVVASIIFTGFKASTIVKASRRVEVPPEKMLLTFRSDIDEEYNYEIYVMRADKQGMGPEGELVERITNTPAPAAEVFPAIGRDCNTIVYCSSVNDMGSNPFFPDFDLFRAKRDTGEITMITDTAQGREYAPSLSVDGTKMSFMVGSFMKNSADLYVMDMSKPKERILIQENLAQNVYPRITADGTMVIYAAPAGDSRKMDIFMVKLEERTVKNLTRTPDLEEYYPDISDDNRIVTYQLQDEGKPEEEKKPEEKIDQPAGTTESTEGVTDQPEGATKTPSGETAKPEPPAGNDGGSPIILGEGQAPPPKPEPGKPQGPSTQPPAGNGTEAQKAPTAKPPAPMPTAEKKRTGDWEIWIMDIGTGKKEKVTDNDYQDVYPLISGDGTWVVYTSAREDYNDDKQEEFMVFIVDLLTGEEKLASSQPKHHDTVEMSW